jgi:hypothetical protein
MRLGATGRHQRQTHRNTHIYTENERRKINNEGTEKRQLGDGRATHRQTGTSGRA